MTGWIARGAAMLAVFMAAGTPIGAVAPRGPSTATIYVRARVAGAAGDLDAAARGLAAVLAANPTDDDLALRTMRQAIVAGDRSIAVRAARLVAARGKVPGDTRLLLLTDAMLRRDWRTADGETAGIAVDPLYGFLAPVLKAWVAVGAGRPDPLAPLGQATPAAAALVGQTRALGLIATGDVEAGVKLIRALPVKGVALARLRLIAAAALARTGEKARALDLVQGPDPAWETARARIAAGAPLPGVTDAASGLAETLIAVSEDLDRERASLPSLSFARLATMLAPQDASGWLLAADRLSAMERREAALAMLTRVAPDGPYGFAARSLRIDLLLDLGRKAEAAAEADALTAGTGANASASAWLRRGDVLLQLSRPAEAAAAYGRAIDRQRATQQPNDAIWPLLILRSGAWLLANDWAKAKLDLAEAYALAPNEAVVLNSWGYSQLERRENVAAATELVERASKLRPDDPAITDSLGWTYYLRGAIAEAVPILERATAGDPDEPTINEHLGDAYWRTGRRLEARYAWRAAALTADEKDKPRLAAKLDAGWTEATGAP